MTYITYIIKMWVYGEASGKVLCCPVQNTTRAARTRARTRASA